jgi:phospholipase/carboxylesterase
MADSLEQGWFEVVRPCRYLCSPGSGRPAILALHGYGMSAGKMLELTRSVVGAGPAIASLEAPNTFFLSPDFQSARIGYNWGTPETAEFHVELHHRMVRALLAELGRKLGTDGRHAALLGFSQSVGLNYRFAAAHPGTVRGVIGICGGVPKNWEEGGTHPVGCALLHISRSEDEYFPPEVTGQAEARLRRRAQDVECHLLPGKHRFPSQAGSVITTWLERVFGA